MYQRQCELKRKPEGDVSQSLMSVGAGSNVSHSHHTPHNASGKGKSKRREDACSVATISMSIATDFDTQADMKPGDSGGRKSYKRTVVLNAMSKPVISLHSLDRNPPPINPTVSIASPEVLAKLMDICAADFVSNDQQLQSQLRNSLKDISYEGTDQEIKGHQRSEENEDGAGSQSRSHSERIDTGQNIYTIEHTISVSNDQRVETALGIANDPLKDRSEDKGQVRILQNILECLPESINMSQASTARKTPVENNNNNNNNNNSKNNSNVKSIMKKNSTESVQTSKKPSEPTALSAPNSNRVFTSSQLSHCGTSQIPKESELQSGNTVGGTKGSRKISFDNPSTTELKTSAKSDATSKSKSAARCQGTASQNVEVARIKKPVRVYEAPPPQLTAPAINDRASPVSYDIERAKMKHPTKVHNAPAAPHQDSGRLEANRDQETRDRVDPSIRISHADTSAKRSTRSRQTFSRGQGSTQDSSRQTDASTGSQRTSRSSTGKSEPAEKSRTMSKKSTNDSQSRNLTGSVVDGESKTADVSHIDREAMVPNENEICSAGSKPVTKDTQRFQPMSTLVSESMSSADGRRQNSDYSTCRKSRSNASKLSNSESLEPSRTIEVSSTDPKKSSRSLAKSKPASTTARSGTTIDVSTSKTGTKSLKGSVSERADKNTTAVNNTTHSARSSGSTESYYTAKQYGAPFVDVDGVKIDDRSSTRKSQNKSSRKPSSRNAPATSIGQSNITNENSQGNVIRITPSHESFSETNRSERDLETIRLQAPTDREAGSTVSLGSTQVGKDSGVYTQNTNATSRMATVRSESLSAGNPPVGQSSGSKEVAMRSGPVWNEIPSGADRKLDKPQKRLESSREEQVSKSNVSAAQTFEVQSTTFDKESGKSSSKKSHRKNDPSVDATMYTVQVQSSTIDRSSSGKTSKRSHKNLEAEKFEEVIKIDKSVNCSMDLQSSSFDSHITEENPIPYNEIISNTSNKRTLEDSLSRKSSKSKDGENRSIDEYRDQNDFFIAVSTASEKPPTVTRDESSMAKTADIDNTKSETESVSDDPKSQCESESYGIPTSAATKSPDPKAPKSLFNEDQEAIYDEPIDSTLRRTGTMERESRPEYSRSRNEPPPEVPPRVPLKNEHDYDKPANVSNVSKSKKSGSRGCRSQKSKSSRISRENDTQQRSQELEGKELGRASSGRHLSHLDNSRTSRASKSVMRSRDASNGTVEYNSLSVSASGSNSNYKSQCDAPRKASSITELRRTTEPRASPNFPVTKTTERSSFVEEREPDYRSCKSCKTGAFKNNKSSRVHSFSHPVSVSQPPLVNHQPHELESGSLRNSKDRNTARIQSEPYSTQVAYTGVVPRDELSRSLSSTRSASLHLQMMMVGEMGESIHPSELEDLSNPDLKNDDILRPILSQKGHQLILQEQGSVDFSQTEYGTSVWPDTELSQASSNGSVSMAPGVHQLHPGYQQYHQKHHTLSPGARSAQDQMSVSDLGSYRSVGGSYTQPVAWNDGVPTAVTGPRLTPVKAQISEAPDDFESFVDNRSQLGSAMVEHPTATVVDNSVNGDETLITASTSISANCLPSNQDQSWSNGVGKDEDMEGTATQSAMEEESRSQTQNRTQVGRSQVLPPGDASVTDRTTHRQPPQQQQKQQHLQRNSKSERERVDQLISASRSQGLSVTDSRTHSSRLLSANSQSHSKVHSRSHLDGSYDESEMKRKKSKSRH